MNITCVSMYLSCVLLLTVIVVSPALADDDTTVVFHYGFDEGSGDTVHDRSDSGNDAKIKKAIWVHKKFGHALQFDGDDAVLVSDAVEMGTKDFTIEAWFKATAVGNNNRIVSAGYKEWELWISHSQLTASIVRENDEVPDYRIKAEGRAVNDNMWHHAVAVFDRGNAIKLYLDGSQCGKADISKDDAHLEAQSVVIGSHPGGIRGFIGFIQEAAVYRGCLSPETINSHYRNGIIKYFAE